MKKRLLVLITVLAMLLSLMAGCASKVEEPSAPVEESVPVEDAPAEEANVVEVCMKLCDFYYSNTGAYQRYISK